ncbi:uncharacterized protein BCR38DRAFT_429338 [Pseudomassariella vexata]|uniref:Mg2+ transporter protein, CorA-like/Zinc transport protein ZntB n=1 Tax=Pseudomassariella vexata TaxID=1141098 RepID=A0A1Y2E3K9_9PEZI|nr:uncharacterized protein BCR38DRAFT_429338 [Pseudomassariella vexata]ORY66138.1 hypothetical protein BCR38DRAFT_429338 [Pseudomassariella vexata]
MDFLRRVSLDSVRLPNDECEGVPSTQTSSSICIFRATSTWKEIDKEAADFLDIFDSLRLDSALIAYVKSSRAGWYALRQMENGLYSFLLKDYMYMLAWTFDPDRMETRAIVCERSEYISRSILKGAGGQFDLPGLCTLHLYHPLALACIVLVDFVSYFDKLLVQEGYQVGGIEDITRHGFWGVDDGQEHEVPEAELIKASRKIARLIGLFANMFKSLEIAHAIAATLKEQDKWRDPLHVSTKVQSAKVHSAEVQDWREKCAISLTEATSILHGRIRAMKQSCQVFDARAKALSSVISTLMRREDTRITNELTKASNKLAAAAARDSSDMKVIAIMTMAFLPATFFAALFALPSLDWQSPGVMDNKFWVYWACTVPTTLAVFILWDVLQANKIKMLFQRWRNPEAVDNETTADQKHKEPQGIQKQDVEMGRGVRDERNRDLLGLAAVDGGLNCQASTFTVSNMAL